MFVGRIIYRHINILEPNRRLELFALTFTLFCIPQFSHSFVAAIIRFEGLRQTGGFVLCPFGY